VVVFHRTFMLRRQSGRTGDGVLLLGRGRRKSTRRLDGAETGPEQNEGEEEGNHSGEHGDHCSEGGSHFRWSPDNPGKRWATRARPWVDRLACAWLIRRFVDPAARFVWLADPAGSTPAPRGALGFDYDGSRSCTPSSSSAGYFEPEAGGHMIDQAWQP
jgi:Chromate resistance exported protein